MNPPRPGVVGEFGILVATPILTGSITRLPPGILTDMYGGRIVFFIQMILVAIPTYGLAFATGYWHFLVIGLFVGPAGGSFAIGIAYGWEMVPKVYSIAMLVMAVIFWLFTWHDPAHDKNSDVAHKRQT